MSRFKYPRTPHLPWSGYKTEDDRVLASADHFAGRLVVVTEKLDGENTTMYREHYHARSLDSANHPSRNLVKALWGSIRHDIPEGFRLCGENVYAKHSIAYTGLTDYFYLFAVYDGANFCLSWDDTKLWAELLGLRTAPEIYVGPYDEGRIKALWPRRSCFGDNCEGYVVRVRDGFPYDDFGQHVAKFVRENHVTTSSYWMKEMVVPNKLISDIL